MITETKGKRYTKDSLVMNDIRITQVSRNKKSIAEWRYAHRAAESATNPDRTRLYDIYDDILLDGHLSGIIDKRISAVLNKRLHYLDAGGERIDGMDAIISSAPFRHVLRLIIEAKLWGLSGIEFLPGSRLQVAAIPRKHIKPERGIISYQQNDAGEGFSYHNEPSLFIVDNGDLGLLLRCAPYVIYKRDAMADWANYIECFGQPVRVIKYDAYDEQTRIELKQVLEESGSSLALMIPKQADFEMKDGKWSNGDGRLQAGFKKALDDELSVLVLGNTETTSNSGTGSQAKSMVHLSQQQELTRADIVYATNILNDERMHTILRSYDLPVTEGGRFTFGQELDTEHLRERIAIDKEVAAIVPVSNDYFYDTYGIPRPSQPDAPTRPLTHAHIPASPLTTAHNIAPAQELSVLQRILKRIGLK
ncbi:hypothetical protein GCM10023093_16880 [Nemorincola caseinilytica]|uniref:DUF935 family protein n=1 Tax=Nemorincola caseinilytica TaxID=2054315 RepID=A0ABP8NGR3_9BACT